MLSRYRVHLSLVSSLPVFSFSGQALRQDIFLLWLKLNTIRRQDLLLKPRVCINLVELLVAVSNNFVFKHSYFLLMAFY